jgi:hypothetical protein
MVGLPSCVGGRISWVAVQLDPGQPQFSRGRLQFLGSDRRQVARRAAQPGRLAVREADHADPNLDGDELGENSAEAERLVVRVGDHGQHTGNTPERIGTAD